jgi:group I intron endonuclease
MSKIGYIYCLKDPRTNEIRYVGQTINEPRKRLSQHIHQEKRTKGKLTHVNSWIRNLKQFNLSPIMEILEECLVSELNTKEIYYIKIFKKRYNLCNHSEGGQGIRGYKMTEKSKIKRLITLSTSVAWAEKHKTHSVFMKQLYKEGHVKFGYKHLSEERRKEIGLKHAKTMKLRFKESSEQNKKMINKIIKPVCLLSEDNNIIKVFRSAAEAARKLKISHSTHVTRVCKKKSKQTHGYKFAYLNKALY